MKTPEEITVWCDMILNRHPNIEDTNFFNSIKDYMKEQRPPQGEWINHRNDYGHNIADCSLCGKTMQWHDEDEDGIPRYCWYCGAKMKGGTE